MENLSTIEINGETQSVDVGGRFGRLIVLNRAANKNGHSAWMCGCECGRVVSVESRNLNRTVLQSELAKLQPRVNGRSASGGAGAGAMQTPNMRIMQTG